jgi:hypothetical protein
MRKLVPILLFFFSCIYSASGDSVRGPVAALLDVGAEAAYARFGPGDLIVIDSSAAGDMHAAIKIEIEIPNAARDFRGAYAVYLYKEIKPPPTIANESYRANAVEFLLLPPSSRFTLYLPLTANFAVDESFDVSIIDTRMSAGDFPIIIALLPVMKGIPTRIAESVFGVEVSFAPSSLGTLRLDLVFPDEETLPHTIMIDGDAKSAERGEFVLPEGLHTLEITSPHYTDELVTFTAEAGGYTDLRIELEARASRLIAEVPEGTRVFLDGELIETPGADGMEIEPGEHTAVFKIGDYTLSRSFSVLPGTTSTLSVDMEIQVNSR